MLSFSPRQLDSTADSSVFNGVSTVAPASAATIGVDNTHTSFVPGLNAGGATITSTSTITTTYSSTPTGTGTHVSTPNNTRSGPSTGAIVGIVLAIFVVLAAVLATVMTTRHRRHLRALAARRTGARKARARLPEPTQMQQIRTATTGKESAVDGDESFLSLKSTHIPPPPPPSANPFRDQSANSGNHPIPSPTPQLPPLAHRDSHIPNPFASPPTSPSHSHSHSSSSHSSAPLPAANPVPRPQIPSIATSSINDYPYHLTDPDPPSPSSLSAFTFPAVPATRRPDPPRELRAMQDLISALDSRGPPPSAYSSHSTTGSRLSMGEDAVTPGGHSIKANVEAAYWTAVEGQDGEQR